MKYQGIQKNQVGRFYYVNDVDLEIIFLDLN
jgi:hypothetical protein